MTGDCGTQYGTASFRGVEFEILPVTNALGRRIVTTNFPFTDRHFNEDLGSNPERFTVSGLFTGEDARDKMTVAKRLWLVKGNGVFFEPTENRSHDVTLLNVIFDNDHTKINHVAFTLELVSKGDEPYPSNATEFFGQADSVVDSYTVDARSFYSRRTIATGDFQSVSSGITVASKFILDALRQHANSDFRRLTSLARNLRGFGDPDLTFNAVAEIFEASIEADAAPLAFYEQVSEIMISGNEVESFQGQLVGLVALSYYFEKLDNRTDFIGLKRFRDRAMLLKKQANDFQTAAAIDSLILEAGTLTRQSNLRFYGGEPHALVASYRLYGNVSRASEIIANSYGVSGSNLSPLRYADD